MPMTQDQIRAAYRRAQQVCDGFACVRIRQAVDAMNLAEDLLIVNRELAALRLLIANRELAALRLAGVDKRESFDDAFGGIFAEKG